MRVDTKTDRIFRRHADHNLEALSVYQPCGEAPDVVERLLFALAEIDIDSRSVRRQQLGQFFPGAESRCRIILLSIGGSHAQHADANNSAAKVRFIGASSGVVTESFRNKRTGAILR